MSKFKIGDKVVIIKSEYLSVRPGEIGTIDKIFQGVSFVYAVIPEKNNYWLSFLEDELELVQSAKNQVIDQMNADKGNIISGGIINGTLPTSGKDGFVVLKPDEKWIPTSRAINCTCGVDSIGGGLHSDYCDKVGL